MLGRYFQTLEPVSDYTRGDNSCSRSKSLLVFLQAEVERKHYIKYLCKDGTQTSLAKEWQDLQVLVFVSDFTTK